MSSRAVEHARTSPTGPSRWILIFAALVFSFLGASSIKAITPVGGEPPAPGFYRGLFYPSANATEANSGFFAARVGREGVYTAKIGIGSQSAAFAGRFSTNGSAEKTVALPGNNSLTIYLAYDVTSATLSGNVTAATWDANLAATLSSFSKHNPAPASGDYTYVLPAGASTEILPGGNGFGSLTVDGLGAVGFRGLLGDGTAMAAGTTVSASGMFPVYAPLYGGKGAFLGWFTVGSNGVTGQAGWFKPARHLDKLYPLGFTNNVEMIGSAYRNTNATARAVLSGVTLALANGGLPESIVQQAGSLTFHTGLGYFQGMATNPVSGLPVKVAGAILQNQNSGGGLFLGGSSVGSVALARGGESFSTSPITPMSSPTNSSTATNAAASTNGGNNVPVVTSTNTAATTVAGVRLGYWPFTNSSFSGSAGQQPVKAQASFVPAWCGTAVALTNPGAATQLQYHIIEANGHTNFSPANGTVRFWFQPNWSTGGPTAPRQFASFFTAWAPDGSSWALSMDTVGASYGGLLQFAFNNAGGLLTEEAFNTKNLSGVPVNFQSNLWYQITLCYSPTNIALYTNGTLLATGNNSVGETGAGLQYTFGNGVAFPMTGAEENGVFSIGCQAGQPTPILGKMAEVETFNYPLTAAQVAAGFPVFAGASTNVMQDSDYDGRSDLQEVLVDGTNPNNPASTAACQLGYWRFDSAAFQSEQGQPPLSLNAAGQAPDWSGTALNITSDSSSHVTYWDVFTNGQANINCRRGTVQFWFKPNWSNNPAGAPFVYVGNPNPASSQWSLNVTPSGQVNFVTCSNGLTLNNLTSGPLPFNAGHWMLLTLTYGPDGSVLYTNGVAAATGRPVTLWPNLSDRNFGFVIGNSTAYATPVNGQFDELQTFNYELNPSNILQSFQSVQWVDADLDGTADLLEDTVLPVSRPFLGVPTVVTATIEAEQFDLGGQGVAYYSLGGNPASSYRPTGLFITNCTDLGLGYCLDQMRVGEWANYSLNVLVAQNYAIDTRVAGIGTNGVFDCEFTSGGFYTNTGPLTITSTNWSTLSAIVGLPAGPCTMRLRCLANGSDGSHTGRFNYISVHAGWTPGFTSPRAYDVPAAQLSTNNSWAVAVQNASVIQSYISAAQTAGGGTIQLPPGNFYLSPAAPNESLPAWRNTALTVTSSNIAIAGAGMTNTSLIAFNRAATLLDVGVLPTSQQVQCVNFTLRDLTLRGQPHLAVRNVTNVTYELGCLLPQSYGGALVLVSGEGSNAESCNFLFTNCQFAHANAGLVCWGWVSNLLVTACDFNMAGGSDVFTGATNAFPSNTANTTPFWCSPAIFGSATPQYNWNIVGNTYNGNTNLAFPAGNTMAYATTNSTERLAPDGFVLFQGGGNFFIAGNTILNNNLEAVQIAAGPSALTGNIFATMINGPSCCAFDIMNGGQIGVTGFTAPNYSASFVGNQVWGGRNAISPQGTDYATYELNVSGNEISLFPPFATEDDFPGAIIWLENCANAALLGNTLAEGGQGLNCATGGSNAIVMNNNFANAAWRSVGISPAGGALPHAQIYNNVMSAGSAINLQLPLSGNAGWFVADNVCYNATGTVAPVFCDPATSAAHVAY